MKKQVLVTGASGFIGKHCLPLLVKEGYKVIGTYNRTQPTVDLPITWEKVDLLNTNQAKDLLEKVRPSHLLHLAWFVEHGKFWTAKQNLLWTSASLQLAHHFEAIGGKRFVASGTCAEYSWDTDAPFDEISSPRIPSTLYGQCKNALFNILSAFSDECDLSFAWGRIFNVYGPGEDPNRFIPHVIRELLRNKKTHCLHGNRVLDFMYVEDLAAVFVKLLSSDLQGAVNVASGQGTQLADVGLLIGKHLDCEHLLDLKRASDCPPKVVASVLRMQKALGVQPKQTLEYGLKKTIQWWNHATSN